MIKGIIVYQRNSQRLRKKCSYLEFFWPVFSKLKYPLHTNKLLVCQTQQNADVKNRLK